jgi:hypothetical protein
MKIQELLETATGMGTSAIATSMPAKKPKKGQKLNLLGTPVSETGKEIKVIKRQP